VDSTGDTSGPVNDPKITADPSITGTAQVGETLTRVAGTSVGPGTITKTWVWELDGDTIADTENDATYVCVLGDIGGVVTIREFHTNFFGTTEAVSDPTAAVIAAG
jgi:hypothetical protein